MSILDERDDRRRAELIAERLTLWRSIANATSAACASERRRLE
jgi:hypothetical protein